MLKPSKCSKLTTGKPNAFGLPRIKTCPGATPVCTEKCYTDKFEKMYPGVLPVLDANLAHCRYVLSEVGGIMPLSIDLYQMVHRTGAEEFRIHWDGDFFAKPYAEAWRGAIECLPAVKFWAYTRSFDYVYIFEGLRNLRLYLSLDRDNYKRGIKCWVDNPWVLLSTMGMPELMYEILPIGGKHSLKMFNCPAVHGKLKGVKGACQKCRVCVDSKSRNIVNFPIHR